MKGLLLLHDNAKTHVLQMTKQKLHDLGYKSFPEPANSYKLATTDHHMFMHLTNYLKENIFRNQDEAENTF